MHRAGDNIEDLCRACKLVRPHRVVAADGGGNILRVVCDYCGSQHNYRGGGERTVALRSAAGAPSPRAVAAPLPLVSERERRFPPMKVRTEDGESVDLELLLRQIIREETGLTAVEPADKWRDGHLVLRPGRPGIQEKTWPIETFFHKIVMLRNRLRVLEQQVNGSDIADDVKVKLQSYITACYGTLTSFNVLFAEDDDRFRGSGGDS